MWDVRETIVMGIRSQSGFSHVPPPTSGLSLTVHQVAANLILPARLTIARATQQDTPVIQHTITTTIRVAVPVIGAWDFAMPVATPRMTVDSDHTGAGSRA
jgi:hypothetical protein